MTVNRRRFIQGSAGISAMGAMGFMGTCQSLEANMQKALPTPSLETPLFIATWPFGKVSCEAAVKVAQQGGSMVDAIEQGIWVTEADVKNASVGIGGIPNAAGDVELDACIMTGPDHNAGSVGGIQDVLHPISVARMVMEKTPHVMLVGEGAQRFAFDNGVSRTDLLTDNQRKRWEEWRAAESAKKPDIDENHHDTIAMLGIDGQGDLYGGCSTSGWGYKIPGRIGDSPIIGSGLYVDNQVGAAGATGLGENVMRHCGSFLVVEMMRSGATPVDACQRAIERIAELDPKNLSNLDINFIAMNKQGVYGAAGTSQGFKYSVASPQESRVLTARALSEKAIGPEGGNRK